MKKIWELLSIENRFVLKIKTVLIQKLSYKFKMQNTIRMHGKMYSLTNRLTRTKNVHKKCNFQR